ncbi:ribonucleoside-diphosphate reductase large chain 1 [Kluyveromyces marxianus]|uniref:Ribonucleoside-diphosphate reductase n=2 Tax=Kluyveromyces marxianus TaxID=4911 RepID=W0TAN2_KLUMD|nr:ribonucleoside-diphosphate reductase large chain 1 [Kluyveromyces marxianus DMKU3-1042]QGN16428.1 ribonucleoside-diphosphate reductase large chain 1 [Kluyveromyces marxianus]BAO40702.1 ribonucleoside-diphosphate reductase large chain 1 [Kluyveromyces marxianus DMKU3-1042]BAP72176.1 ribonucleoside-diphosphate reductase large chain 1 [Kluyveromyces marxianus]
MTDTVELWDAKSSQKKSFNKDKLIEFLGSLTFGLNKDYLDITLVVDKILLGAPNELTDKAKFVSYVAETVAAMSSTHPDYSTLAARVEIRELHELIGKSTFTENLAKLRKIVDAPEDQSKRRKLSSRSLSKNLISEEFYQYALKHRDQIDKAIDMSRDYYFTYFGWKTLCKSYLMKRNNEETYETPQFMFMRVALAIHGPFNDIDAVLETYQLMSQKYFIHASPTLFNSGTVNQYLSSCFLVAMEEDSIDGIYKTLHKTALISKASGGIGIHVSNIRANGAYISGSNGTSNGLVPMLRVFNNTARYVDQGGNKRPGAFCIYLEPWHGDIIDFLQLRKNHGKEEMRARDLFYALWIPDLFMQRVENNEDWSIFSPDEATGLSDCYGTEFKTLYEKYERELIPMKKMKAQQIWSEILQSQTETGVPFMLYKDSCNEKSNQKNLGVIKSSNLCCEIVEYSSPEEVAVCNLASVALPTYVKITSDDSPVFDFVTLHRVVKVLVRNLDRTIDVGAYPIPEAKRGNLRHRPLAIGVQGLADAFMLCRTPFESEDAATLNKQIFETIYHAAIEASIELAEKYGHYESFPGSPAQKGELQFDMWGLNKENYHFLFDDWDTLKQQITNGPGLRNSLLVGPMPTASTSQILGFTESFEPMTSNIYSRRVLSGEFTIVNQYMVDDFCKMKVWNEKLKNRILKDNGSIQTIDGVPEEMKSLYKTVWEISQKKLIDLSRDRAPFIDQSQSLNLYLREPTMGKLTSMHFYAWKKGLKTGMYYLRTQAASRAIQFTLNDENTLLDKLSTHASDTTKVLPKKFLGQYPDHANDENHKSDNSSQGDIYGIHDTTPLICNIIEGATCESCSG